MEEEEEKKIIKKWRRRTKRKLGGGGEENDEEWTDLVLNFKNKIRVTDHVVCDDGQKWRRQLIVSIGQALTTNLCCKI